MSGVYGNMLQSFPELMRSIKCWTKDDKSDIRDVVVVDLPASMDSLKRRKFSNRGTGIDYSDDDHVYVDEGELDKIGVGDYFYDPDEPKVIHRVMGKQDFDHPGGFVLFLTERVTGATVDQQEELEVKEAYFA